MKKKKITSGIRFIRQKKNIDYWLLLMTIFFSVFGIIMIFEASNVAALVNFSDKYYFVKEQIIWFVIGSTLMLILAKVNYKKYYMLSVPLILITILTLVAVLIPGLGLKVLGARRWLNLGFFRFQPSELSKFALIIYLSSWFSGKEKKRLFAFLILFGLIVGLVLMQPDMGTAVMLSTLFLVLYFLSGANFFHFVLLIPFVIISMVVLAVLKPYRYTRLVSFLDPGFDPLGASYHIRQILLSLGSGGFWGMGLGASRQKYLYLPEATTDSIFAIIAEEFGFLGTALYVIVFVFFLSRIFNIVKNAPDKYSFLLSGGILTLFSFQAIINLSSMVVLMPLTGIPLPFVSYGGSSLIINLICIGVLLNISKFATNKK